MARSDERAGVWGTTSTTESADVPSATSLVCIARNWLCSMPGVVVPSSDHEATSNNFRKVMRLSLRARLRNLTRGARTKKVIQFMTKAARLGR